MPSKGREHFSTYTQQSRVKHAILTKYLGAYLKILGPRVDAIHYIDGFAGTGTYEGQHEGSPLSAIALLSEFPRQGLASFVEDNARSFSELEAAVAGAPGSSALLDAPWLKRGEFSDCLDELLGRPASLNARKVATFAFVDPCGLKGLYLEDLAKILKLPYSECLVFLNYDGLTRWAGAIRKGTHAAEKFERFYGSRSSAEAALASLESTKPSREAEALSIYVEALRQHSGAQYFLPFRFQSKDRKRTSHYLMHLSQDALAFKIMKEVMLNESTPSDDFGTFEFIPGSDLGEQGLLFRPNAERARDEILNELRSGPQQARLFLKDWPLRRTDMFVEKQYREILLALEAEQLIEVIDEKTSDVVPAHKRRKYKGGPTLGERYSIRVRL
jgi:three-Cys-motif partner protein